MKRLQNRAYALLVSVITLMTCVSTTSCGSDDLEDLFNKLGGVVYQDMDTKISVTYFSTANYNNPLIFIIPKTMLGKEIDLSAKGDWQVGGPETGGVHDGSEGYYEKGSYLYILTKNKNKIELRFKLIRLGRTIEGSYEGKMYNSKDALDEALKKGKI
ncbi:hypothetical protein [Prevotella koreensis]|uniref:hypothetical protein n=2 Tax=Prevotella koreensis TaxID=2490854 RepID=UPI0028E7902C|nr:hypothetical protein [Prevotella koreensis]